MEEILENLADKCEKQSEKILALVILGLGIRLEIQDSRVQTPLKSKDFKDVEVLSTILRE